MRSADCSGPPRRIEEARRLEVWCGNKIDGVVRLRTSSIAARAVLKFFDPKLNAELRDPRSQEIFRYDSARDALVQSCG